MNIVSIELLHISEIKEKHPELKGYSTQQALEIGLFQEKFISDFPINILGINLNFEGCCAYPMCLFLNEKKETCILMMQADGEKIGISFLNTLKMKLEIVNIEKAYADKNKHGELNEALGYFFGDQDDLDLTKGVSDFAEKGYVLEKFKLQWGSTLTCYAKLESENSDLFFYSALIEDGSKKMFIMEKDEKNSSVSFLTFNLSEYGIVN